VSKKKPSPRPGTAARPRPGTAARPTAPQAGGGYSVEAALADLRACVEGGDQLTAEVRTATLLGTGASGGAAQAEKFVATLIAAAARWDNREAAAAFCRLLMVLGSGNVKRMASGALRELTSSGVYPPEWVNGIGKPVPEAAWRRYDVFGDDEAVAITFRYGETRFATLTMVDLTMIPVAVTVGVVADPDKLIATLEGDSELQRCEQIPLARARRHTEAPLSRAAIGGLSRLSGTSAAFLPAVRAYLRRLPDDGEHPAAYSAADRAAAVEDFLAGGADAGGADAGALRFWAQTLTGYSGRVPGEPPAQVGPRKLGALLGHVANTFTLTQEQQAALRPAVTAWVTWAAARQGLPDDATAQLLASLPKALDGFAASYDDPHSVLSRAYLRDVAVPDAEVTDLAAVATRRSWAVPFPEAGSEARPEADVASPDGRATLVAAEFASCQLEPGETRESLTGEAARVIEELWSGEPPATWEAARRLAGEGRARHDAIHALTRKA
jgi:hypothetical protein